MNGPRRRGIVLALFVVTVLGIVVNFGQLYEWVGVIGIGGLFVTAAGLSYVYLKGSEDWRETLGPFLPGDPPEQPTPVEHPNEEPIAPEAGAQVPPPDDPPPNDDDDAPPAVGEVDRRSVLVGGVLATLGLGLTVGAPTVNEALHGPGPAFRAAASGTINGSRFLSLRRPDGVEAGDVLLAQLHGRSRASFGAPEGWNPVASISGSGDTMNCFWKLAADGEPLSYDFDGQEPNGKGGGITAWSGIDPTDPIIESKVAEESATPQVVIPSVTSPFPATPVIMMVGSIGPVGITMPGAMKIRWSVDSPPGEYDSTSVCATTLRAAPAGASDEVARIDIDPGFGGWVGILVALRPA